MGERFSDSMEATKELTVALDNNKRMWLGGMFDCFWGLANILGKPDLLQEGM